MKIPTGVVPFAIGNAITFREGGANPPVYRVVEQYVRQKAEPIEVRKIENRKRKYPKHITALKPGRGERQVI